MSTRIFRSTEPDALVTSVSLIPGRVYGVPDSVTYVRFSVRQRSHRVPVLNEDALALASRLLGRDVTEDT